MTLHYLTLKAILLTLVAIPISGLVLIVLALDLLLSVWTLNGEGIVRGVLHTGAAILVFHYLVEKRTEAIRDREIYLMAEGMRDL